MQNKTLDIKQIMAKIPHRFPFIMIDRIIDYEESKRIRAIKNVTMNEPFFQGHFPAEPIMPGVLMIEAMAQAGGVLALISRTDLTDAIALFMTIDNAKFRKPAVPGDQLLVDVTALVVKSNYVKMHGDVFVNPSARFSCSGLTPSEAEWVKDDKICEADFMFSIFDRNKL